MKLDRQWKPKLDGDYKDIVSTDNRKLIIDSTGVVKSNLVNYIGDLRKKGILIYNQRGGTEVNPFFMVEPEDGVLEITLILNCNEQKKSN